MDYKSIFQLHEDFAAENVYPHPDNLVSSVLDVVTELGEVSKEVLIISHWVNKEVKEITNEELFNDMNYVRIRDELGDLLFNMVNLLRRSGVTSYSDMEILMRSAIAKYGRRIEAHGHMGSSDYLKHS